MAKKPLIVGQHLVINSYLLFGAAFLTLVGILVMAAFRELLQYNLLFLVAVSLVVAVLLAFIPVSETEFKIPGSLRAGGAVAVFAFCLWLVVPFAQKYSEVQFEKLRLENRTLKTTVAAAETTARALQASLTEVSMDYEAKLDLFWAYYDWNEKRQSIIRAAATDVSGELRQAWFHLRKIKCDEVPFNVADDCIAASTKIARARDSVAAIGALFGDIPNFASGSTDLPFYLPPSLPPRTRRENATPSPDPAK